MQCGELVSRGQDFNAALGSVFSALKERYPPGSTSRVPWRSLGFVDVNELLRLGLREDDVVKVFEEDFTDENEVSTARLRSRSVK